MAANIHTSTRGNTLTVRVSGPLDRRIASSLFSRFLLARSRYDGLVIDLTDVDEVYDAGLAALRLLRSRARQAGKRLSVVDSYKGDCIAHSATPCDEEHTPVIATAGQSPLELSPFVGAPGLRHACQPPALSDAARMGNPTPCGEESRGVRALSTWRRWLNRLATLLSVASLIAWSVAVVLVMWSALADTPAVALDTVWLLAASALLSSASLLLAMGLDRETVTDPEPDLRTTISLYTDHALD